MMAGVAQRDIEAKSDVVTSLAALLERWQVKPRRNPRWFHDVTSAFEEQERADYLRYQRVSALAVDIARLLGLPRWSQAAVRLSALLAALARLSGEGSFVARKGWDAEIGRWRWVQACIPIVEAVGSAGNEGRLRSRRAKALPAEAPVLSLAQEFDELTVGESGVPRMRTPEALHVLRESKERRFDGQLVDLFWSEAGQAVCDNFLRRRVPLQEEAATLLEQSVRVLEREAPAVPGSSPRESPPRRAEGAKEQRPSDSEAPAGRRAPSSGPPQEEKPSDERAVAAAGAKGSKMPGEGYTRRNEMRHRDAAAEEAVDERSREMTKSSTKEEEKVGAEAASAKASAQGVTSGGPAAVHLQLARVVRDLEEIRSTADRSLQTMASLAPAIEELSTLISQLQRSFLRLQDGGSASDSVEREPERPRTLSLRVERPDGSLDADEVAGVLDNIRDLTDVAVREHGPSWAVLQAGIQPEVDLSILEAKVTGSLTRHLGGDGASIEVSFL